MEEVAHRLQSQQRASQVSAYRELYGWDHETEPCGPEPDGDSAARKHIREAVWTGLHDKCLPSSAAGLSYQVTHPILAGTTAVVTVGYAGAAAAIGSEQITFTYTGGKWYYQPSDLSVYAHHDLAQAVAAAKTRRGLLTPRGGRPQRP